MQHTKSLTHRICDDDDKYFRFNTMNSILVRSVKEIRTSNERKRNNHVVNHRFRFACVCVCELAQRRSGHRCFGWFGSVYARCRIFFLQFRLRSFMIWRRRCARGYPVYLYSVMYLMHTHSVTIHQQEKLIQTGTNNNIIAECLINTFIPPFVRMFMFNV